MALPWMPVDPSQQMVPCSLPSHPSALLHPSRVGKRTGRTNLRKKKKNVFQDKDVLINKATKLKWYKGIIYQLPEVGQSPATLNWNGYFKKTSLYFSPLKMKNRGKLCHLPCFWGILFFFYCFFFLLPI